MDCRVFEGSDYSLPQNYVNKFTREVGSGGAATPNHNEETCLPIDTNHTVADAQDVDDANQEDGCPALNWTAAGEKGTWGIFKESGIFASACQHGFILWLIDMIQSGEL
jgi:hypothetical protein